MSQRGEMQEIVQRQRDMDLVVSRRRHLRLADVVSPAPAGGADGIAEYPKPGLVPIDAFFVGRPARERRYRFDGLGHIIRRRLTRLLIVRTDAPDDFERRFLHARKPPLGEIGFCGRPGRGQQKDKQDNQDGQDAHRGTSSETKPTPGQNSKRKRRASPMRVGCFRFPRGVFPSPRNNCGLKLPAGVFASTYNSGEVVDQREKNRPNAAKLSGRRFLPRSGALSPYCVVIQARASRCAMAISTSDIISATSRRSGTASARPFRAARLNHLCAATRLTTPERPLAQYRPRSNSTSGIAFASTAIAVSRSMCP